MTLSSRMALMACIVALSLAVVLAPGSAQDKQGTMGKDTMSTGGDTITKDKMGKDPAKDGMKRDEMKKDETKKKDEMKK